MRMDIKHLEATTQYQFLSPTVIQMDQEAQEIILKSGLTSCKLADKHLIRNNNPSTDSMEMDF